MDMKQGKQKRGWWRHPQCGATTNSEGISPSEDRGWKDSLAAPAPTPDVPGRRRILRREPGLLASRLRRDGRPLRRALAMYEELGDKPGIAEATTTSPSYR